MPHRALGGGHRRRSRRRIRLARSGARGRSDRLEQLCERRNFLDGADGACRHSQHRDGGRRRLRRGQRDRRGLRSVSPDPCGRPAVLAGRSGGDGSLSRRLGSRPITAGNPPDALRRVSPRDTPRACEDRRDRSRRSCSRRDARGPRERRPQWLVHVRDRHDAGAWRPSPPPSPSTRRRVGNDAVPAPERRHASLDGPRADEKAYADDSTRKSFGSLTSTTRTADETMAAIFGRRSRDLRRRCGRCLRASR